MSYNWGRTDETAGNIDCLLQKYIKFNRNNSFYFEDIGNSFLNAKKRFSDIYRKHNIKKPQRKVKEEITIEWR